MRPDAPAQPEGQLSPTTALTHRAIACEIRHQNHRDKAVLSRDMMTAVLRLRAKRPIRSGRPSRAISAKFVTDVLWRPLGAAARPPPIESDVLRANVDPPHLPEHMAGGPDAQIRP